MVRLEGGDPPTRAVSLTVFFPFFFLMTPLSESHKFMVCVWKTHQDTIKSILTQPHLPKTSLDSPKHLETPILSQGCL